MDCKIVIKNMSIVGLCNGYVIMVVPESLYDVIKFCEPKMIANAMEIEPSILGSRYLIKVSKEDFPKFMYDFT